MFPYLSLELCHCLFKSVCLLSPLPPAGLGLLELTVEPCQLGLVTLLEGSKRNSSQKSALNSP